MVYCKDVGGLYRGSQGARRWVFTMSQAARLLEALAPLPRTMAGLAMLTGLRRGELFALRGRDLDEESRLLTIREAIWWWRS